MDIVLTRWKQAIPPAREELEILLEKEGFSPLAHTDAAGTHYAEHQHAHTEVRWVYKGKIKIGTGGKIYELGPGDRLDMPPKTVHWAEVPDGAPVSYLCGEK